MPSRFPLFLRVLLVALLNVALVELGFTLMVEDEDGNRVGGVFEYGAGARFVRAGREIRQELDHAPTGEWGGILDEYQDKLGMEFLLFDREGRRIAGKAIAIPDEVFDRLRDSVPVTPTVINPLVEGSSDLQFDRLADGFQREPGRLNGAGPTAPALARFVDCFFVETDQSPRYWMGLRLPPVRNDFRQPAPLTLLAVVERLGEPASANGSRWLAGLIVLVVTLAVWLPFARGLTRSIRELTDATERIAAGQFEVAVNVGRTDEIGRLGHAIKRMAGRLAGFVSGQKRFLGDTAHELCSPLARMQMAVGVLEDKVDEKQRAYLEDIREEATHMSDLVNELLSFSKASMRPDQVRFETIPLKALVEKCVAREAHDRAKVRVEIDEKLTVSANRELLSRAIGNLLRNAVRYAGKSGPMGVKAVGKGEHIIVSVWDSGSGIAEKELERVFDPFYRPDPSRTSRTGGVGLGLAIVRTCIEACGGAVKARNRKSGGLKVLIKLNSDQDTLVSGFDETTGSGSKG